MSLKLFHIFFIVLSVLISVGFGLWALLVNGLPEGFRSMGVVSLLCGVSLVIYGIRFLKKSKSIIV